MKKIFSLALAAVFALALAYVAIAEDKPAEGTDTQGTQIENPAEVPAAETEGQAVENANQPDEAQGQAADAADQAKESNPAEQQQQK